MKNFNMSKIEGPDACIETSLFEYGLAWIPSNDGKEVLFWYGISMSDDNEYREPLYNRFDFRSFPADLDVKKEFDFADFDRVCSFVGMDEAEWLETPITSKIFDLMAYYGYENIFGTSYTRGFIYNAGINRFIPFYKIQRGK